ncbi:MAG: phosphatase PAP2 family protein [Flavobacteriales bacterium]|nr:phosphatase PAP2 family protein [Flavobacteriales bacterium]|tara:strand:- start:6728 stop:7405 length:678 start_codon:yes stop_codon:yes gene_type:complete
MNNLQKIDEYIFRLINSTGWEQMDEVMILISSKWFWIPVYVYILYLIYKRFSGQFLKILFSLGFLIFLADFGSVHLFKEVFERSRPCHFLEGIRVVDGCGGPFGFISSHASNYFSITFFIALLFRKFWGFVHLFSWAVIVGFSRIYLGVHYPFDILGGMFWGLFVSLLVYYIYRMKIKNFDWIWFAWLALVCIWNFVWPSVPPIADVLAAIILSLLVVFIKKIKK